MANFRETLWFKKGLLDAAAAASPEGGTAAEGGTADAGAPSSTLLPVEDRYLDDGSLTRQDERELSLRTGTTRHISVIETPPPRGAGGPVDVLVDDLKRGRGKLIAVVVGTLAVVIAAVVAFAL